MTGNRRFWPVDVGLHPAKKSVWEDLPQRGGPDLGGSVCILAAWGKAVPYKGRGGNRRGCAGRTQGDFGKRRNHPGFSGKEDSGRLEQLRPDEKTDVLERAAAWRADTAGGPAEGVRDGDLGRVFRRRSKIYPEKRQHGNQRRNGRTAGMGKGENSWSAWGVWTTTRVQKVSTNYVYKVVFIVDVCIRL